MLYRGKSFFSPVVIEFCCLRMEPACYSCLGISRTTRAFYSLTSFQGVLRRKSLETLENLRRGIHNKRRGMLSASVVLIHDIARPHTVNVTKNIVQNFRSQRLPPVSAHEEFLSGHHFSTDEDVQTTVTHWLHSQAANFYDTGLQILWYDKCSGDSYDEK